MNLQPRLVHREEDDTLMITTLNPQGRSTQNMPAFAESPAGLGRWSAGAEPRWRETCDTHTLMRSMVFTVMAALAQMELGSNTSGPPTLWPNPGRPRTWVGGARPSLPPKSVPRGD